MDQIDKMIVTEVLQLRKQINDSRRKLGLPEKDYLGMPVNATALQEQISNS